MRVVILTLLLCSSAVCAPRAVPQEIIDACRDDALRLCSAEIFQGRERLRACMERHRAEASAACREAVARHAR